MASPPPPRWRWLLDGSWSCLSARADSLHGHAYDRSEHCPIRRYEPGQWTDSQGPGYWGWP